MAVISLQHVQVTLPARAEAQAKRFYGELLELIEIPRPASLLEAGRNGIWYRLGQAQELHIFLHPGAFDASARSQHPALVVDDLANLRERLEQAGCTIEEAIPIAGRARFFTRDPGGNRIEFLALTQP